MKEELLNYKSSEFSIQKEKSPKKIIIPILVLVFLLLAGATIVLASRIWDPLWNPFRPKPEKVIERMFQKVWQVKTFQDKSDISLICNSKNKFSLRLKTEGKYDFCYLFGSYACRN